MRKLIKVAKECKQAHMPCPPKSRSRASSDLLKQAPPKPHVLGEKFAAATRKSDEESDLDLDFVPEKGTTGELIFRFAPDSANAHLAAGHAGATTIAPGRVSSSIPFSSLSILQRTDHAPGPGVEHDVQVAPAAFPVHHNAISRAFVKTIGRLGRWKRVLNLRHPERTSPSVGAGADVSAFDPQLSGEEVGGGRVEQLAKRPRPPPMPSGLETPAVLTAPPPAVVPAQAQQTRVVPLEEPLEPELQLDVPSENAAVPAQVADAALTTPAEVGGDVVNETAAVSPTGPDDEAVSVRSASTDSFGQPLASGGPAPIFPHVGQSQWQFDVVSIDDLDLSDTSSDHNVGPPAPPGLRRPGRKLPPRRDFEFLRRSAVSSMGIISRDSFASNRSSVASSSGGGGGAGLGAGVAPWQLSALVDSLSDDDEKGDVEDALKRLEGQVNVQKQVEKASKVDGWVRNIRERMAAGDYKDDLSMFSEDDDDDNEGGVEGSGGDPDQTLSSDDFDDSASQHGGVSPSALPVPAPRKTSGEFAEDDPEMIQTPRVPYVPPTAGHDPVSGSSDRKPPPEPAIPLEILQSRIPSRPTTADASLKTSLSRFTRNETRHRSFILNYRASTLAEHFAMIDREVFMSIKFEELVLDDWMAVKEVDVLSWGQFLKNRAQWKEQSRFPEKTSALAAARGRFNLMANFTIAEIVLTSPHDRPILVGKFIRIAWVMCFFPFALIPLEREVDPLVV